MVVMERKARPMKTDSISTAKHPPHVYLDDTWYVITAAIHQNRRILQSDDHKELVRDHLRALVVKFDFQLAAWVILDNHYHLLVKTRISSDLPLFFARLHGRTSFELNRRDARRGRQVWHNYWDTCIRSESDYWTRFNYIHYNPVKHGYVSGCEDWPFSSYRHYLGRKGRDWLADALHRYPVIDFDDPRDKF